MCTYAQEYEILEENYNRKPQMVAITCKQVASLAAHKKYQYI